MVPHLNIRDCPLSKDILCQVCLIFGEWFWRTALRSGELNVFSTNELLPNCEDDGSVTSCTLGGIYAEQSHFRDDGKH